MHFNLNFMNRKIKLVWKFSGCDASEIAKHHLYHLRQYIKENKLQVFKTNYERFDENTVISYVVITDDLLEKIKNDLKPHNGFLI